MRRNIFELIKENKDRISSEDFENMKNNLFKIIENYRDILLWLYIIKEGDIVNITNTDILYCNFLCLENDKFYN